MGRETAGVRNVRIIFLTRNRDDRFNTLVNLGHDCVNVHAASKVNGEIIPRSKLGIGFCVASTIKWLFIRDLRNTSLRIRDIRNCVLGSVAVRSCDNRRGGNCHAPIPYYARGEHDVLNTRNGLSQIPLRHLYVVLARKGQIADGLLRTE